MRKVFLVLAAVLTLGVTLGGTTAEARGYHRGGGHGWSGHDNGQHRGWAKHGNRGYHYGRSANRYSYRR